MTSKELVSLIRLPLGEDFKDMQAKDFETLIVNCLFMNGEIMTQVKVPNRGDGRSGRIDLIFRYKGEEIPIEIDRKSMRQKSIFKVKSINEKNAFIILRSPYQIIKV